MCSGVVVVGGVATHLLVDMFLMILRGSVDVFAQMLSFVRAHATPETHQPYI